MSTRSALSASWTVLAARAVIALTAGLIVTFSSDHSAEFGLTVFGAFALATAAALAWGAWTQRERLIALQFGIAAAVAAACGTVALAADGFAALVAVVVAFAAVTGAIELGVSLRLRRQGASVTDGVVVGILNLIIALAVVLIPRDFTNAWETVAKDGTVLSGTVTAEVFVVGVFGAYAFVLGVYLAIAAVSARSAQVARNSVRREPARVSGEG